MNANHLSVIAFREVTAQSVPLSLATQVCPGCKRTRSLGQFTDGKKKCNKCRGKK